MNKIAFSLALLLSLLLASCTEEQEAARPRDLSFSFDLLDLSNGRIKEIDLAHASVVATISDEQGSPLASLKPLRILAFGSTYTTEPITLIPGRYYLTHFMIVADDEVLYAVPKAESKHATLVDQHLPIEFNITENQVTNLSVQVVNTWGLTPESFGYASFGLKRVYPLRISIFAAKEGRFEFVNASLFIESQDSVTQSAELAAKTNVIAFRGDPWGDYTIRVEKEGYETSTMAFNLQNHIAENGLKPITIVLEEEKKLILKGDRPRLYLTFSGVGSISVQWPGGGEENLSFSPLPGDPDMHSYAFLQSPNADVEGETTITGSLDKITALALVGRLESVEFADLSQLNSLTLESNDLSSLDLSMNQRLTTLSFVNTSIGDLNLPSIHLIDNVLVEGSRDLRFPLDELVAAIHANAVARNTTDGAFIMFNAGDLSSETLTLLTNLEEQLQWYIEIE